MHKFMKYVNSTNIGRFLIVLLMIAIISNVVISNQKKETIETFEDSTGEKYDVYRKIINTFNTILSRNPNTSELFKYYKKVNEDKLDTNKLKVSLENTDEYKRTQKTQNNMINNEETTTINDQQLDDDIIKTYSQLFQQNPDDVTIKFYRKKYSDELSMDINKLKKYMMETPDYKKYEEIIKETNDEIKKEDQPAKTTVPKVKTAKIKPIESKGVTLSDGKSSYVINRPNINVYNFTKDNGETEQDVIDKSRGLINNTTYKTDSITKTNIDEKQEDMCPKKKISMAKNNENRNMNELKYKCNTNKRYSNADDFGKLMPEFKWTMPQANKGACYGAEYSANPLMSQSALIGTLLDDADNTSVGSILPKFSYKQEV